MKELRLRLEKWSKLIMLVFLLALTFSYAMFQGGFVSWFLFYSFLPFGVYALVILLYPLNDFHVERIAGDRALRAGDSLEMRILLKRQYPVPILYISVEELLPRNLDISSGSMKKNNRRGS